jgi:hypothetical protein
MQSGILNLAPIAENIFRRIVLVWRKGADVTWERCADKFGIFGRAVFPSLTEYRTDITGASAIDADVTRFVIRVGLRRENLRCLRPVLLLRRSRSGFP